MPIIPRLDFLEKAQSQITSMPWGTSYCLTANSSGNLIRRFLSLLNLIPSSSVNEFSISSSVTFDRSGSSIAISVWNLGYNSLFEYAKMNEENNCAKSLLLDKANKDTKVSDLLRSA